MTAAAVTALFLVVAGQEALATLARDPFCQADAPAVYAALAWTHFSLASSLGCTSISLIQRRVTITVASPSVTEIIRAG